MPEKEDRQTLMLSASSQKKVVKMAVNFMKDFLMLDVELIGRNRIGIANNTYHIGGKQDNLKKLPVARM